MNNILDRGQGTCLLGCASKGVEIQRIAIDSLVQAWEWRIDSLERLCPLPGSEIALRRCEECGLVWADPQWAGSPAFYEALSVGSTSYYEESRFEFEAAARHLTTGARVLEVGAGAGHFSRFVPGGSYIGLESNLAAVEEAKRQGRNVVNASVGEFLISDPALLDAVCLFQVLEHVPSPADFLEPLVRKLRPGGGLFVAVPSDDSYVGRLENATLNLPPHHLTRWPDRALVRLGSALGLELVALHHEGLSDGHSPVRSAKLKDCASVLLREALYELLGRPWLPLRMRLSDRILRRMLEGPSRQLAKRLERSSLGLWGHTVLAVYQKTADTAKGVALNDQACSTNAPGAR